MSLTLDTKKELTNAKVRLDNQGFDEEIRILDQYLDKLGSELQLAENRITEIVEDVEVRPLTPKRSLQTHIENLCTEIALDLQLKARGVVAFGGFAAQSNRSRNVTDLASATAFAAIARVSTVSLIRQDTVDSAIRKQGFSLFDLTDKLNAVAVGQSLSADYIITGTVIESVSTIIVFSRLLNVSSQEVESAAQVIVAKY